MASLPGDSKARSGAIEASGKTDSPREALQKLSARNVKLNAKSLSGPPEAVQYTAKSVLPSVKTGKALLSEKTAVSAEEKSLLSASAAETGLNRLHPEQVNSAIVCFINHPNHYLRR